jgi:hypothetical protein
MTTTKTSELTGPALDWAVAKCEGIQWEQGDLDAGEYGPGFKPSTNWAQGGPIIEREGITLDYDAHDGDKLWEARRYAFDGTLLHNEYDPTPLIAAMRTYVASRLGDIVDVPAELIPA